MSEAIPCGLQGHLEQACCSTALQRGTCQLGIALKDLYNTQLLQVAYKTATSSPGGIVLLCQPPPDFDLHNEHELESCGRAQGSQFGSF